MRHLLNNRYAFVILGDGSVGKSTMMTKLLGQRVEYNSHVGLELDHTKQKVKFIYKPNHINIVCCSRSFYCENKEEIFEILEEKLTDIAYQFAVIPEQPACLHKLVNTLSQNHYHITCYHIYINEDDVRYISINNEDFKLGEVGSNEYLKNIEKIKKDMYRQIMPI